MDNKEWISIVTDTIEKYDKNKIAEKIKNKENREKLKQKKLEIKESIKKKLTPEELKFIKFK